MSRKIVIGIGLTLALLFVLPFLAYFVLRPWPRPFDSQTWKRCEHHSVRFAMHEDLVKHHQVIGMTADRLTDLLGEPEGKNKTELSWDLGKYFGADDSAIDFKLQDGKVVSFDVWGH